jgi:hypothetical protein
MSLLLGAALALSVAHLLPGALVVGSMGLGRSALERFVMAAVLGGPLAAGIYLVALVLPIPGIYWIVLGIVDVAAVAVGMHRPPRAREEADAPTRGELALLLLVILVVEGAYLATTAPLFRFDRDGSFVMDPAFQEDELFHVGMVRALEVSYPPQLLTEAGVRALYHVGYDLQVAAWSRWFGIDPFDGFHRVAPLFYLPLLVVSAFLLARRFGDRRAALLSAVLVFGSGLGFLFYAAPGANWWSLVFMDASLVSLFLVNPLLPALSLFFVAAACLHDYLDKGQRGSLAAAALSFSFLVILKVFLAAQMLLALAFAIVVSRGTGSPRLRRAAAVLALAAAPVAVGMMFQAASTNTAVGIRPLEIVRYSMETLGWRGIADSLARVGAGDPSPGGLAVAIAATGIWLVGFLGIRIVSLPGVVRDALSRGTSLRQPLAIFVLLSFPMSLLLRIAPAEATGLSRTEALNDAFWFATEGGVLLWFWTAETLVRSKRFRGVVPFVALLAFPGAIQHFIHKASLAPDVVPAAVVEATRECRLLSDPTDVFVEPVNRMRPSLRPYLAGRPVVNDLFVGYDYMFTGLREIELRHHAVAQFWATTDPGYAAWFLHRYHVRWAYVPRGTTFPSAAAPWSRKVFENEAATVYRFVSTGPDVGDTSVALPSRIPLGVQGDPFFGRGWSAPERGSRTRELLPGRASLYLPTNDATPIRIDLELQSPHAPGRLETRDATTLLDRERPEATIFAAAGTTASGLAELAITWEGDSPLCVTSLRLSSLPPRETRGGENPGSDPRRSSDVTRRVGNLRKSTSALP